MKPVTIFDLAWIGVPAAFAGLLYLIFVAPRLLSGVKAPATSSIWLRRFLSEFKVKTASSLIEKTPRDAGFTSPAGLRLLSARRGGVETAPAPDSKLQAEDSNS